MPALRWLICDIGIIPIFLKASNIVRFGMDRRTLEMMYLLAGLMSLRIGIIWSLIFIDCVVWIRLSNICLLDRNMQKRLFDILETNVMFLGWTIFPISNIYSILGNTIDRIKD